MALANGVFECAPETVWRTVFARNRPDVPLEDVRLILDEYERVDLLRRWVEPDSKEWAWVVNIDKPGRLMPPSKRIERACGPQPPIWQQDGERKQNATGAEAKRYRSGSETLPERKRNGASGIGIGTGLGTGIGKDVLSLGKKEPKKASVLCLPDSIPVDAWNGYLEMRIMIKKPMSERAKVLAVTRLEKLKTQGHDPRGVLDQSTLNSWQGLFPVKQGQTGQSAPDGPGMRWGVRLF
jgi:hypothetical protein